MPRRTFRPRKPQVKSRNHRNLNYIVLHILTCLAEPYHSTKSCCRWFLKQPFLPELNRRFIVPAASPADLHRARPQKLKEVLSWEETRIVRKDWTVGWEGRWFQIDRQHERLSLADRPIIVRASERSDPVGV